MYLKTLESANSKCINVQKSAQKYYKPPKIERKYICTPKHIKVCFEKYEICTNSQNYPKITESNRMLPKKSRNIQTCKSFKKYTKMSKVSKSTLKYSKVTKCTWKYLNVAIYTNFQNCSNYTNFPKVTESN